MLQLVSSHKHTLLLTTKKTTIKTLLTMPRCILPASRCISFRFCLSVSLCASAYLCVTLCISVHLCVPLSFFVSLCVSVYLGMALCISQRSILCVSSSIFREYHIMSVYLCASVFISVCLCASLCICVRLCVSLYLSICICVYERASLCASVCLYVTNYVHLSSICVSG